MRVSIVVPFYNEVDNVEAVLREIREHQPEAELIAVDDGSTDGTRERLERFEGIRAVVFPKNLGQSAAIYHGLHLASGDVCVLLDGDGQNDPADIGALVERWAQGDADVVCGYRANRRDTWSRRVASRWANRIRRLILDDGVRDTGCSLKAFPRAAVDLLVPFNGLHRYFPAIFKHAGLRLAEVAVNHRPRVAGVSKYTNWERALRGIHDLFGVSWLLKRKTLFPEVLEAVRERRRGVLSPSGGEAGAHE